MSLRTPKELSIALQQALASSDVATHVASALRGGTAEDAARALIREILDADPMPRIRRSVAEGVAATLAGWDDVQQRAFFAAAIAEVPRGEDALLAMGIQVLRLVAKALGPSPLTDEILQATITLETESRYAGSALAPRLARAWYQASQTPEAALGELRTLSEDTDALAREPGLGGGLLLLLGALEIGFGSVSDGLAAFERVPLANAAPLRVSQFLPVFQGSDLAEAVTGLLLNVQVGWRRGAFASLENVASALAAEGREEDAARVRRWRERRLVGGDAH